MDNLTNLIPAINDLLIIDCRRRLESYVFSRLDGNHDQNSRLACDIRVSGKASRHRKGELGTSVSACESNKRSIDQESDTCLADTPSSFVPRRIV